ncbi:MAG: energy transducer TonB [Gammaproteobacteria bacterium]|nr:energy transducer TonB [Gammaproteobacteria bacterium]MDH3768837.1 energy transducer TonB [Gammaproteobacteria bacterium]
MATKGDSVQSQAVELAGSGAGMAARIGIGLVLGVVVTTGLLWTMHYLISTGKDELGEDKSVRLVDFVRLKRSEFVNRREIKPEKPPAPEAPPDTPPTPKLDDVNASADKIAISAVPVETSIELTGAGFSLGVGEGDYLPIVKVSPIYPDRALSRGIEGFCIVQYTVTKEGRTRDPFVVEDQCTSSLFHRASLNASMKFKYKPRVVDGEPIEVPGVQNKFTYQIEN